MEIQKVYVKQLIGQHFGKISDVFYLNCSKISYIEIKETSFGRVMTFNVYFEVKYLKITSIDTIILCFFDFDKGSNCLPHVDEDEKNELLDRIRENDRKIEDLYQKIKEKVMEKNSERRELIDEIKGLSEMMRYAPPVSNGSDEYQRSLKHFEKMQRIEEKN